MTSAESARGDDGSRALPAGFAARLQAFHLVPPGLFLLLVPTTLAFGLKGAVNTGPSREIAECRALSQVHAIVGAVALVVIAGTFALARRKLAAGPLGEAVAKRIGAVLLLRLAALLAAGTVGIVASFEVTWSHVAQVYPRFAWNYASPAILLVYCLGAFPTRARLARMAGKLARSAGAAGAAP